MILPLALSMAMMSPACTFSFCRDSIILVPRSYMVSISVVFKVNLPCRDILMSERLTADVARLAPAGKSQQNSRPQSLRHFFRDRLSQLRNSRDLSDEAECMPDSGSPAEGLTIFAMLPVAGRSISTSTTCTLQLSAYMASAQIPLTMLGSC